MFFMVSGSDMEVFNSNCLLFTILVYYIKYEWNNIVKKYTFTLKIQNLCFWVPSFLGKIMNPFVLKTKIVNFNCNIFKQSDKVAKFFIEFN